MGPADYDGLRDQKIEMKAKSTEIRAHLAAVTTRLKRLRKRAEWAAKKAKTGPSGAKARSIFVGLNVRAEARTLRICWVYCTG
jgi:hypothetical protein